MQPSDIPAIIVNLSAKRISRYKRVRFAGDDIAIRTYVWNLDLCGALLPAINFAEITIRNAFDSELRERFGLRWFENTRFLDQLPARHRGAIGNAVKTARHQRGRRFEADEIVSEMSLGFWVQLATRKAERSIWANRFPVLLLGRTSPQSLDVLYRKLDRIRVLRNRIAHHDAIFDRDLTDEHANLREIIGLRCQSTAVLLDAVSKLPHELSRRPGN